MTRFRFWITQFIWLLAAGISIGAATDGDPEAVPVILFLAFIITGFTNRWGSRKDKNTSQSVMGYNNHIVARVIATAFIWVIYMGGTVAAVSEMAGWGVLMALVLMIPATLFTAFIWLWERINGIQPEQLQSMMENTEKRKRRNLDSVVGKLSEEELRELRHRLQDVSPEYDDDYQRGLSDDGEIVYHHRN